MKKVEENKLDRLGVLLKGDSKQQKKLITSSVSSEIFRFDDLIIEGNYIEAATRYCRTNPLVKYRVWLIDNYPILFTHLHSNNEKDYELL